MRRLTISRLYLYLILVMRTEHIHTQEPIEHNNIIKSTQSPTLVWWDLTEIQTETIFIPKQLLPKSEGITTNSQDSNAKI